MNTQALKFFNVLSFAILAIFTYLVVNTVFNTGPKVFTSDSLQFNAMYRDFFWYHYPLSGWAVTGAAYFFPETILNGILFYLTNNFAIALFIQQILELATIYTLFILLSRTLFPKNYHLTILPLSLFFTYIIAINLDFAKEPDILYNFVTQPFCHLANLVVSLFCLWIILAMWEKRNIFLQIMLFMICFLSTISDELLFLCFAAPLFITALILRFKQHHIPTKYINIIMSACLLGFIVEQFSPYHEGSRLFLHITWPPTDLWLLLFKNYYIFYSPFWIFTLLLTIYLTYYLWIKKNISNELKNFNSDIMYSNNNFSSAEKISTTKIQLLATYISIMTISSVIILLCSKHFKNIADLRYITPALILPCYFAIIYLSIWCYARRRQIFILPFLAILTIILFFKIIHISPPITFKNNWAFNHIPRSVNCIDHFASEFKTPYGLAQYWIARPTTFFSQKNLWLNQIIAEGKVLRLNNNKYWYLESLEDRDAKPQYSFLILNEKDLDFFAIHDPIAIQKNFGKPDKIENCRQFGNANTKIYIYNKPASINKLNQNFVTYNADFFNAKN